MYFRRAFERLAPAELRELKVTTGRTTFGPLFLELPLLDLHVYTLEMHYYDR